MAQNMMVLSGILAGCVLLALCILVWWLLRRKAPSGVALKVCTSDMSDGRDTKQQNVIHCRKHGKRARQTKTVQEGGTEV